MVAPLYYGEVSSQLKGFIDRTFSYLKLDYTTNPSPSRLSPGKKLVFIQTRGQPEENEFADVFPRYEYFFKWWEFDDNHLIRACGVMDKGDVENRPYVMELAERTAKKLV